MTEAVGKNVYKCLVLAIPWGTAAIKNKMKVLTHTLTRRESTKEE
jgi:hypothetical protein